jgi:hypothetical protein
MPIIYNMKRSTPEALRLKCLRLAGAVRTSRSESRSRFNLLDGLAFDRKLRTGAGPTEAGEKGVPSLAAVFPAAIPEFKDSCVF